MPIHPNLSIGRASRHHARVIRREDETGGVLRALLESDPATRVVTRAVPPHYIGPEGDKLTARWSWRPYEAGGVHMIEVFSGLRHTATGITDGLSPATCTRRYRAFCREVVRHETAHARFTERDAEKLRLACTDGGPRVPFMLWNLLEDVRIEAAERKRSGEWFRWHRHVAPIPHTSDPLLWIFDHKCSEGPYGGCGWSGPDHTAEGIDAAHFLAEFYRRVAKAPDSLALIPLAREFLKHFPVKKWPGTVPVPDRIGDVSDPEGLPIEDAPPSGPTAPLRGDLSEPGEAIDGDKEGLKTWEGVGEDGTIWQKSRMWKERTEGRTHGRTLQEYIAKPHERITPPDLLLVRELSVRLGRIVRLVGEVPARLSEEGSRLYLPAVVAHEPDCWLARRECAETPRLVLVVDMSGSMGGLWYHMGGRELILAFRDLAKRGRIYLRAWFTGHHEGGARLSPFASDREWFALRPGFRIEDYPRTLELAKPDLHWARLAVCYSDSNLTDGRVDVSVWRARGIDLVGCCVAPDPDTMREFAEMQKANFGRSVVDTSIHGLASQLAVALSRRR